MQPLSESRVFSDRYELTHLVARGGMAQVYRAVDRLLDRPVALKVLFPELSVDRTFVERFKREAQAAANLSHPNIVPVYDWGEDSGTYFIVMEYVDGNSLSAVLKAQGALPPDRAVAVAAPVAAALGFAHRHGVVHRDVKPGNVLLTTDGQVKVTDFGIARAMNTEESLTQTGAVMGTATYFSPEQAEGAGVDARSDIYSLGVVLYEMLVGRPPFLGDTPVAVASKHVRDEVPLPRELNPAVPTQLENVVMQALAKSPDRRYQTAEDFRQDLLRYAAGQPVTAANAVVTSVMAPAVGAAAGAATGTMAGIGATQAVGATGSGTTRTVTLADAGLPPDDHYPPDDRDERARRSRRLTVLVIALVVVLAVVLFFLGRSLNWWGSGSSSVTVPDVRGQTVAAATATLGANGLHVGGDVKVASSQPTGVVVRTSPAVETSVAKGTSVTLYVSGGESVTQVTVPYVIGNDLSTAESRLGDQGLTYAVKSESSTSDNQGIVLNQAPTAGNRVGKGSTVTLYVSNGPPATTTLPPSTTTTAQTTTVPNVICETPSQAGNALGNQGLTVAAQTSEQSSVCGTGLVVATNPAAGAVVPTGTGVTLVVSSGSPPPNTTTTGTTPPQSTTSTTATPGGSGSGT